jgi:RNA polymerase primary sigma factor
LNKKEKEWVCKTTQDNSYNNLNKTNNFMKRGILITENFTNVTTESFKNYLNDISKISLFDNPQDEADCAFRAKKGDNKAKEELVVRNLRFVVSVAKKYENENAPLTDLINQGNIGLIEAANRFDPDTGNKFISYAVWWVRKEIMEYLNNLSKPIRLPMTRMDHITKFNEAVNKVMHEEGGELSAIQLYGKLDGFDNNDIDNMLDIESYNVKSYDKKITLSDGEGNSLIDLLESTTDPTDHLLLSKEKQTIVNGIFKSLKPIEEMIVKKYFGIGDTQPMTLNEIGNDLDLSRERVRQIKEKTLKKLRRKILMSGVNEYNI